MALALPVAAAGGATEESPRTRIVQWSPFVAGKLDPRLPLEHVGRGRCGDGPASHLSPIAYRCFFGHLIADPCWRVGRGSVVCVGDPWARSATLVAVPRLLLDAGVTFGASRLDDPPWGLELMNGDRCTLLSGARGAVVVRGALVTIDYHCRSGLQLLRNLRRGRLWRIGSAWPHGARGRYAGDVDVRRAFLTALPPPMDRQNELARRAAAAAVATIAARRLEITPFRVRMALPEGDWARVLLYVGVRGTDEAFFRHPVLRRARGKWRWARALKPYCANLRPAVRRQLFEPGECPTRRA